MLLCKLTTWHIILFQDVLKPHLVHSVTLKGSSPGYSELVPTATECNLARKYHQGNKSSKFPIWWNIHRSYTDHSNNNYNLLMGIFQRI